MLNHGGEKGVPFRFQINTFKDNESREYTEQLHSASCQVKVLKPKGADRKQKTDREQMEDPGEGQVSAFLCNHRPDRAITSSFK
jgi:hypothetical protein